MAEGLWRATCSCGWRSTPSADLAGQTDELDQHLRVVVISEQRPTRTARTATAATLRLVDHTLALGALVVGLVVAAPVVLRAGRAA